MERLTQQGSAELRIPHQDLRTLPAVRGNWALEISSLGRNPRFPDYIYIYINIHTYAHTIT